MKTDILRRKFLSFFESKGHTVMPSAPLIPENDQTLLFTGAGMNPFKEFYLGKTKPPFPRITTVQKCMRTVDIERVGRTAAHHTFFEMLGNFSFGDYFKRETIAWAWEFLLKELKIPESRLLVSVYKDDQESYDIWLKEIMLPPEKIYKLGAKDNFWPSNAPLDGPNGPCGPCSEIFYDFGKEHGCGLPTCSIECDCNRFVEIWNLVFTQFDRQEDGSLNPLPQKNIDTGMGLERLAAVMQNVISNFEIDIFKPLIKETAAILKVEYDTDREEGARIKRIVDHARALVFTSSEGLLPSNEGRGYVVRRILRRAARDGRTLGMKEPFIYKLVPAVINVMKEGYPELPDKENHIVRIIKAEESKFLETVEQGMALLDEIINTLAPKGIKLFPGDEAFKLYDTYGFPMDLTESILRERGFKLDLQGYENAMKNQRTRSRASSQIAQKIFAETPISEVKSFLKETKFVGYEVTESPVKIVAILSGGKLVPDATKGTEVSVITEKTPFYGESGGQVGDTGIIKSDAVEISITDTQHIEDYIIHIGKVKKGSVKSGEVLTALVNLARRKSIARNHTATHILQNALRSIAGEHIEQSGSLVEPERLRFDFAHFNPLSPDELKLIEDRVNDKILEGLSVNTRLLTLEEAKKQGALAFFGDKYGENVRMVEISGLSRELCGGTHVSNTGEIGMFKIISEASIASGTRRIEAVTGTGAIKLFREEEQILKDITGLLETVPAKAIAKTKTMLAEIKTLRQETSKYCQQNNQELAKEFLARAQDLKGIKIVAELLPDKTVDDMRLMSDSLMNNPSPVIAFIGTEANKRATIILAISPKLAEKGLDAVGIIKEVAVTIGGSGGGRKDFAQAGGKEPGKLKDARDQFLKIIAQKL
ncbi:MAG: alanine--tRNA ligase [Planctomycetes bacterium]|nr:alanine--tRNA ligase [Planctomycetota bacterium]